MDTGMHRYEGDAAKTLPHPGVLRKDVGAHRISWVTVARIVSAIARPPRSGSAGRTPDDMMCAGTMPDVYTATVRDISGFAKSLVPQVRLRPVVQDVERLNGVMERCGRDADFRSKRMVEPVDEEQEQAQQRGDPLPGPREHVGC